MFFLTPHRYYPFKKCESPLRTSRILSIPETVNATKRVKNMESNTNRMMRELVFLCILAVCTPFVSARTISVADHGIVSDKDVTYELNQLIRTVQNEPDVTLAFPRGQVSSTPRMPGRSTPRFPITTTA